MNRTAAYLTLLTLALSALWLALMITSLAQAGPLDTLDQAIAYAGQPGLVTRLNYGNAGLLTLAATAFYAALFRVVRPAIPTRAGVGLVFVPVYCGLNLLCYLSQVTVVPVLAAELADPAAAPAARLLLAQLIHAWPGSAAAFFNALAYAVLGIPSILYGMALVGEQGTLRVGGALLALNGAACIIGWLGMLVGIQALSIGSLVGGVLFVGALPFLALGLRQP
jgi:hypothetical protein